jgi:hypothetical protein
MPLLDKRPPKFKPAKGLQAEWETFKGGLNLFERQTELDVNEYSQGDNIMLVGSGTPTGRWGSSKYFTANATGSVRGYGTFRANASGINELVALSDEGYLAKKDGTTSVALTGQSYPSGSIVRSEQLGGYAYFVSEDVPLTRYQGDDLEVFATLSAPTNVTATNFSGATGTYTYSWRITTLSDTGETTGSTAVELPNLPQDLSDTQINIGWDLASGDVRGYQIYRGRPGEETLLAAAGASTSTYVDRGDAASETAELPFSNTTGGVKSKFVTKFKDRLLMVDAEDPNKLIISGRYPYQDRFNWIDGGGYIYIDPDSGDDITGIAVQPGADRIVVYKNYAHYAVELSTVTIGNFLVLDPQYQAVSTSIGCSNPDTIQTVENDTFYFGRKGLYVTGYEPNFLNIIRTNEVSARIRPYLDLLNDDDYTTATALYVDNKYILSFPKRKEMIVYDRERGAFIGLWKLPYGISHMRNYVDGTGTERWVLGSDESNQSYIFNSALNTDDGTAIQKIFRTNKETFGSWSLLKIVKLFYILLKNISGQVNVNILVENRDGTTSTAKSFTIEGSAISGSLGWGIDDWGTANWGTSDGSVITQSDELTKYTQLFKSVRLVQVEVTTTQSNANFELLGIRMTAKSQGEGSLSSASRV